MFACFGRGTTKEEKEAAKVEKAERTKSAATLVQLEGLMKQAIERHSSAKEPLVVSCYDDLPEDIKDLLQMSEIDSNTDIWVILQCLNFLIKRKFKYTGDGEERSVPDDSRKKVPKPQLPSVESLLTPGDPSVQYKVGDMVGEGGFGSVYLAKLKKGKGRVAIKKMDHISSGQQNDNLTEVYFLKNCDQPNVVKFLSAHHVGDQLWMLMEFMEGGTLTEAAVKYKFQEKHVAYVAQEVLKGLSYLHAKNFIHRDLKSPNIMLTTSGEIKMVDFGLCVDVSDGGMLNSMAGSPLWMPPEMIKGEDYFFKADIWSFGTCMLELINQEPPFLLKGAIKVCLTVPVSSNTRSLPHIKIGHGDGRC